MESLEKQFFFSQYQSLDVIAESEKSKVERVFYPMIVLRTPKGWTGPKLVEGKKVEGTFRSHQVPIPLENSSK